MTQENSLGETWHDHGLKLNVQYLLTPYHDSRLEFQNHSNPKSKDQESQQLVRAVGLSDSSCQPASTSRGMPSKCQDI